MKIAQLLPSFARKPLVTGPKPYEPAAAPPGQFVAGKVTRPSWNVTRSPMQIVKRAYGEF